MEQLSQISQLSPYVYPLLPIHNTIVNPDMIIAKVAIAYGIEAKELYKKNRSREIVEPRQVIFFLLRSSGITYMKIASIFKVNHATVIYHCRRVIELLVVDKYFRERTEGLI